MPAAKAVDEETQGQEA
jgi:hypothetical protein